MVGAVSARPDRCTDRREERLLGARHRHRCREADRRRGNAEGAARRACDHAARDADRPHAAGRTAPAVPLGPGAPGRLRQQRSARAGPRCERRRRLRDRAARSVAWHRQLRMAERGRAACRLSRSAARPDAAAVERARQAARAGGRASGAAARRRSTHGAAEARLREEGAAGDVRRTRRHTGRAAQRQVLPCRLPRLLPVQRRLHRRSADRLRRLGPRGGIDRSRCGRNQQGAGERPHDGAGQARRRSAARRRRSAALFGGGAGARIRPPPRRRSALRRQVGQVVPLGRHAVARGQQPARRPFRPRGVSRRRRHCPRTSAGSPSH